MEEWAAEIERNAFNEPVRFQCEVECNVPNAGCWSVWRNATLKAVVNVAAVGAVDSKDWCCSFENDECICELDDIEMTVGEACRLLKCNRFKLADMFHNSVQDDVYQHIIESTSGPTN